MYICRGTACSEHKLGHIHTKALLMPLKGDQDAGFMHCKKALDRSQLAARD